MNDTAEDQGPGFSEPEEKFLIVGIGASAGGIPALKTFFAGVTADSGVAYVVILHLSPHHESRLAEVLQGVSTIPVMQVRERTRVEPNRVYVIPPNHSLSMEEGHLALSEIERIEERRAPIDIFFRTLAQTHDSHAVCVVLSGTGADGSMGLKRVKECGGICIAQDPRDAAHSEMPRHAIATELVDEVLPAAEIAAKIVAYKENRSRADTSLGEEPQSAERALLDILAQLRARTGHDFAGYKLASVARRVERRIAVHDLAGLAAYAHFFRTDANEATALLKDLLISVTNFFRDRTAFEALERIVIPRLFEGKGREDHVRVWAAGCATGEEVYSIAMLLCEHKGREENAPILQVFATDIDDAALAKARAGLYTLADVADVSPERLRHFFIKERDGYRVRPELREIVLFAPHNVVKHPPYSHLGLVVCRNLLIYVTREAQEKLMQVFHFGLDPGGYLFLGSSESVDGAASLFAVVDKDARIYQSRAVLPRTSLAFSTLNLNPLPLRGQEPKISRPEQRAQERLSHQEIHQRLLEQYAPPSVLINEDYEVVHLSPSVGRYMQVPGGEASKDLLKMVRPELRLELRTALYEASQTRARVDAPTLPIQIDGQTERVDLSIRPIFSEHDPSHGFILVLFSKADAKSDSDAATPRTMSSAAEPVTRHLEEELARGKSQLRASVEQHELQQEELKATNEELQSMNEELRSASEELETSKEELQSYNEELSTVNQELKVKIEELTQANNDTRNLMNATGMATVFLDRALRIKLLTPFARDIFNVIPADVGRPLLDINHRLRYESLIADIEQVLETLQSVEREVASIEGEWYIARILPYRTGNDQIDGVVLTFANISSRKRAEEALIATEDQFRRALEDAPIPVIMHAEDGEVLQVSRTWTELTGYELKDVPTIETWLTYAYGPGADAVRDHVQDLFVGTRARLDVEFAVRTREGAERYWSFSASSPGKLRDGRRFIVGMAVDITEGRNATEALRRSEEHLRLTLESVHEYAIITTDPSGKIESWNAGAERTFGYSEGEARGQHVGMIFTPEDRAQGRPEEEMRQAREHGRAADERWHLHKDGSRFYVSGVLAPLIDRGRLLGYTKVARDLTESRRAQEALRQAREDLEVRVRERTAELARSNEALQLEVAERKQSEEMRVRLLGQLVEAQENERRRISRELHDQLGQQVTAMSLKLSALKREADVTRAVGEELENLEGIVEQLDADLDFLVWQLRPTALDDLGLRDALTDYVENWSRHFGVQARLHARGMEVGRLSSEIETVLYRISQEALNNVAKHAEAQHVDVIIERGREQVALIIEDNGRGFNTELQPAANAKGLGLVGIRERVALTGGTVDIESRVGNGTTVFVRIPTPDDAAGEQHSE